MEKNVENLQRRLESVEAPSHEQSIPIFHSPLNPLDSRRSILTPANTVSPAKEDHILSPTDAGSELVSILASMNEGKDPTVMRTLDKLVVSGSKIDECFALYVPPLKSQIIMLTCLDSFATTIHCFRFSTLA